MRAETATIIANGKRKVVKLPCSVSEFLSSCGFRATQVVVEHNGVVLERDKVTNVELRDGDRIEVIMPVAGG
jgi:thiamine biosynthesis protein ThiS